MDVQQLLFWQWFGNYQRIYIGLIYSIFENFQPLFLNFDKKSPPSPKIECASLAGCAILAGRSVFALSLLGVLSLIWDSHLFQAQISLCGYPKCPNIQPFLQPRQFYDPVFL